MSRRTVTTDSFVRQRLSLIEVVGSQRHYIPKIRLPEHPMVHLGQYVRLDEPLRTLCGLIFTIYMPSESAAPTCLKCIAEA